VTSSANPLLDPPLITPDRLERLEGAIASLFETRLDVVLPQAEAVLPLEAAARSLGRSDLTVLNLDTSPYGTTMGRWMQETGANVIGIAPEPHEAVRPEAVNRALSEHPDISVVSFVHVEAASGVRNDAAAISDLAHEHGTLMVIDVVASIGAHEVRLDEWGADIAVIGPQKALAGPAGISIAAVSRRAWQAMADNPGAPRNSLLSLLDWKERWLDSDKSAIPGTPAPLEIIALEAAIERVSTEGLQHVQLRHRASAAASRSGARALGLTPFASDIDAAAVATTLRAPAGLDARALVERARAGRLVAISPGFGKLAGTVLRIDHTGQRARLGVVLEALEALGGALEGCSRLHGSIRDALAAAEQAWTAEEEGALS
jgi:aspartate aminotransferase-like enzyme